MMIACPDCKSEIEVADPDSMDELYCASCGSSFHIRQHPTMTWSSRRRERSLGKFVLIDAIGAGAFGTVYKAREIYSGEAASRAPELIAGFRREYRNSDESTQGEVPEVLIEDNRKKWSGCHLMAAEEVPGVLFSNRKMSSRGDQGPMLYDLTVTLLGEYGIEPPAGMVGRPLWSVSCTETSSRNADGLPRTLISCL